MRYTLPSLLQERPLSGTGGIALKHIYPAGVKWWSRWGLPPASYTIKSRSCFADRRTRTGWRGKANGVKVASAACNFHDRGIFQMKKILLKRSWLNIGGLVRIQYTSINIWRHYLYNRSDQHLSAPLLASAMNITEIHLMSLRRNIDAECTCMQGCSRLWLAVIMHPKNDQVSSQHNTALQKTIAKTGNVSIRRNTC